MAGFNVADIFASSQLGTQELARIAGERAGLAGDSAALAKDAAQGEATIAAQQMKDEQRTSEVIKAFSTDVGANADRPDTYIMGTLGATAREYAMKAVEQRKQVAELDSVSFLDNPIAYIPNQLQADGIEREANSNAAVADEANKQMQLINQSITTGAAAQEKINHTVTAAMTADKLKAISANAQLTANTIQDKALSFQAEATKVQMEGNKEMMSLISTQHSMMMQDEHLKLAKTQFAKSMLGQERQNTLLGIQIQDANIRLKKEQRAEVDFEQEQKLKEQQQAAQALMAAELDSTAAKLKLNFTIPGETPQAKMDWMKMNEKNPLLKDKINALVNVASGISAQKALGYIDVKPILAEQPAQALWVATTLGAQAGTDKEQKLRTYLEQQQSEAMQLKPVLSTIQETKMSKNTSSVKAATLFGQRVPQANASETITNAETGISSKTQRMEAIISDKKSTAENNAAFNQFLGYNASRMIANVESGADNLYAPPRPAELASFGQFSKSKFYKEVLVPQIDNGAADFSAESITRLAIDAVQKGVIGKNEVVPLMYNYITETMNFNNIQYNYHTYGYAPQSSYNVYAETPLGEQKQFNLAKPADLSNFVQMQTYLANRSILGKLDDISGMAARREAISTGVSHTAKATLKLFSGGN